MVIREIAILVVIAGVVVMMILLATMVARFGLLRFGRFDHFAVK